MYGVDDGEAFTAHVEPGQAAALVAWLDRMRFMMRVEVADVTDELAVAWRPSARMRRRRRTPATSSSRAPSSRRTPRRPGRPAACGPSRRCASPAASPGSGSTPTTARSPTRSGWIGPAVHLDKGCYRGQETVARVHTLGRPPRRLTMLHLDGSDNRLPARGSDLLLGEKVVGFVGTSARHHELGPIALALVKRNVPLDATLVADGLRGRPGGRRRPRGRAARAAHPALSAAQAFSRSATLSLGGSTKR